MNRRAGLAASCALAICGCGSSGSSSSPDTGSAATAAPSVPALKGPPIATAHFGAVLPHGFEVTTSTAPPNAANGKPPELQLTGPHTANGLKELIRVDLISTGSTAALKDVQGLTIAAARKRGDTIVSGPDPTTAGGQDAYQYEAQFKNTSNGHTARRESILVRGGQSDYAIIFIAAPKVYAADLKTFKGFLSSITFK